MIKQNLLKKNVAIQKLNNYLQGGGINTIADALSRKSELEQLILRQYPQ